MTNSLTVTVNIEELEGVVAGMISWPSAAQEIANYLSATNPGFDRQKFLRRIEEQWEGRNEFPDPDDEIPY